MFKVFSKAKKFKIDFEKSTKNFKIFKMSDVNTDMKNGMWEILMSFGKILGSWYHALRQILMGAAINHAFFPLKSFSIEKSMIDIYGIRPIWRGNSEKVLQIRDTRVRLPEEVWFGMIDPCLLTCMHIPTTHIFPCHKSIQKEISNFENKRISILISKK